MIRPFSKAYGSPVRRVSGVLTPLASQKPTLLRRTVARVRRLHLMVVDLHRRRRMADRVLRLLVEIQVHRCADKCWNTLAWKQNQEAYQLRCILEYAMDGSKVRLDTCSYMAPLGIKHFFDAFALSHKGPGEQPHAKLWTFPPAMFQRIPILNRCMRTSSRLLQGAS